MDFDAKEVCLKLPTFRAPGSRSSQTCGKSPLCHIHIQATWSADRGIRGRGQLLREGGWRREVWARTQRNRSQECYQYEALELRFWVWGLKFGSSEKSVCVWESYQSPTQIASISWAMSGKVPSSTFGGFGGSP